MIRLEDLNKAQAKKYIEGYNLKINNLKEDISDEGKTLCKGWYAKYGYEQARSNICSLQLQGKSWEEIQSTIGYLGE